MNAFTQEVNPADHCPPLAGKYSGYVTISNGGGQSGIELLNVQEQFAWRSNKLETTNHIEFSVGQIKKSP